MTARPTISVITAVRNGMPFFSDALASVISQTYPEIEYIVADGGSTDGTLEVIRAHEARIAHWVSGKDDGIADAFNKGLRLARGDYLLFLNSDDRLTAPHAVAEMVEEIVKHDRPELIYGDCRLIERATGHFRYITRVPFSYAALKRGAMIPHPSLFMSRTYFDRFGLYDTTYRIAMDFEILVRGANAVRIVHVPNVVTDVRDGGLSARQTALAAREMVRALRQHGLIRSAAGAVGLQAYFATRRAARSFLRLIGAYQIFNRLRGTPTAS